MTRGPRDLSETTGPCLRRIGRLARNNCAAWDTIEHVAEQVMEWRLDWPQLHDPAFAKLDHFLRKHHPGFHLEPPQEPNYVETPA